MILKTTAVIGTALAVTLGAGVAVAAEGQRDLRRLAGTSRFDTAVAISKEAFPTGARALYLARADSFADALAGSSLTDKGPILLVPKCGTVPSAIIAEANRLKPLEVVALGGTGAVCDQVLQQFAGATSDAAPGTDNVTLSGPGSMTTTAFPLDGGDYGITYNLSGACSYNVTLSSTRSDPFEFEVIASGTGPFTGSTNAFNLSNQQYFINVTADNSTSCPFSVTVTSK